MPQTEEALKIVLAEKENHPERFAEVLDAMRRRVPGVTEVEARPTEDGRLVGLLSALDLVGLLIDMD